MARIMNIQPCSRMIRVRNKTVMDINSNQKFFSMWIHAAGQENGLDICPLNIQLDKGMAIRLRDALSEFIEDREG